MICPLCWNYAWFLCICKTIYILNGFDSSLFPHSLCVSSDLSYSSDPFVTSLLPNQPRAFFSLLFPFSLNLLTPFLPLFLSSFLSPSSSLSLSPRRQAETFRPTTLHYDSSTFPWQNQGRESNDRLLCLHLVPQLGLWKKALCPRTLHRLRRYVLCCPYRKGLWCDWNFWGPWEKMSELEPQLSPWHLFPRRSLHLRCEKLLPVIWKRP